MNKNSAMKYLFLQAKVCCGWCIEAEYHTFSDVKLYIDRLYVNRRPTKFKIVHLQSNPDSMKPALYEIIS